MASIAKYESQADDTTERGPKTHVEPGGAASQELKAQRPKPYLKNYQVNCVNGTFNF